MLGFGWVTQEKIHGTIKVNNFLTKMIKKYFVQNGYKPFRDDEMNNRNCLCKDGQYIIVYTRERKEERNAIAWAPYEYVKKMAQNEKYKNVILILGILDNDAPEGTLYWLNREEILDALEGLSMEKRDHYYTLSEALVKDKGGTAYFINQEELEVCLNDIMDQGGV